jgi:hypothetical protein
MNEQITNDETGTLLKGVLLHGSKRRRAEHHKHVTDKRDTSAVENEIVSALVEFLTRRFSIDEQRLSIVKPFANLMPDADLKAVHAVLSSDLNLETLGLQYDELMNMEAVKIQALRTASLRK